MTFEPGDLVTSHLSDRTGTVTGVESAGRLQVTGITTDGLAAFLLPGDLEKVTGDE
jgi:2-keto-4-pentenoate hydratase/2-oxohepta-3-ene-1,7-dioic acid hydratase in catechol pathway